MISTGLLVFALVVAVVACLIIAWHTRRWPKPDSGRSPFGRLNRHQMAKVLGRQTGEFSEGER